MTYIFLQIKSSYLKLFYINLDLDFLSNYYPSGCHAP